MPTEPFQFPASDEPAWVASVTRDWPAYFARVEGMGPRETLLQALDAFDAVGPPDARRRAVDLGCGSGRDTAELLRRGWHVDAYDAHPEAFQRLLARGDIGPTPRLAMHYQAFEHTAGLPRGLPRCALVNASFALPFCPPAHFPALWQTVAAAVEPGGRFAGQFFGDRDTWAAIPDRSHHTRAQAEALLAGFELERFDEEEKDAEDAHGRRKHWHVFHVVARRPG